MGTTVLLAVALLLVGTTVLLAVALLTVLLAVVLLAPPDQTQPGLPSLPPKQLR